MVIAEKENSSTLEFGFLPADFARSESPLSFEEYEDEEDIDKKAFELLTNAVITPEEIFPEINYQNRDDIYRELLWRTGSESEENDINEMYLLILGDRAYRYMLKEAGLYEKFEKELISTHFRSKPSQIENPWVSNNHLYPLQQGERRWIARLLGYSIGMKRIDKSYYDNKHRDKRQREEEYGRAIMERNKDWLAIIADLKEVKMYDEVLPTLFSSYVHNHFRNYPNIQSLSQLLMNCFQFESSIKDRGYKTDFFRGRFWRVLNKISDDGNLYSSDGYYEIVNGYENDRDTLDLRTLLYSVIYEFMGRLENVRL